MEVESEGLPKENPVVRLERRKWSDADKVNALAVLASCGGNIEAAARQTKIPASTLRIWRDRPASGTVRATLAVREELLAQSLERLLWRLGRSARHKIADAKLAAVMSSFALVFDRWKTLRDRTASGAANAGASAGLDLGKLSSEELRALMSLVGKAGGSLGPASMDSGMGRGAVLPGDGLPGDGLDPADGDGLLVLTAAEVLGEVSPLGEGEDVSEEARPGEGGGADPAALDVAAGEPGGGESGTLPGGGCRAGRRPGGATPLG